MKLLKLKLRGAIGIQKGLGVEEVEVDMTNFAPGLIALTGKNGAGKTTIMENLHPYRTMVSRTGSLQSHFYLKDSYRMLEFEHNGVTYKSKILIDALTGGSEAYLLERRDNTTFAMNDGKLTTYDAVIEKLLGSQDLFFNSVFSGQKSKGIADLKPADRRKLFYELLALNQYDVYLEDAKSKLKIEENNLARIEGEISSIDVFENGNLMPDFSIIEQNNHIVSNYKEPFSVAFGFTHTSLNEKTRFFYLLDLLLLPLLEFLLLFGKFFLYVFLLGA